MTAVLGGLSAAYHSLKNSSQSVHNNVESNVFGGWISSFKYPIEGFILEMKIETLAQSNSERRSVTSHLD